jgi:hypothetical protein
MSRRINFVLTALAATCATGALGQQSTPSLPFVAVQPADFVQPGSLAVAWADYDRDGDLDFAVSGKAGEVRLYRNDGGRFVSIGKALGLPTAGYELRALSWGDYDGDGWPDLLAGPTAVENVSLVFRNLRGKGFVDVAANIGLTLAGRSARHNNWIDYDNDGDLDLYATNRAGGNKLYRNAGGRFEMVPAEAAPSDMRFTVGACWLDYDRDGDLDVFLANQAGMTDALWRNDGSRFVDVAPQVGVDNPGRDKTEGGVGCAVGDYDNDGYLDLFVPNYGRNTLYKGGPNGTLTNVAAQLGVGVDNHAVGAAWGDYDNDGWLDLMVTSYVGGSGKQEPMNALFHNNGGTGFTNVLADSGILNAGDHGATWIDYDRDGALDLSLTDGYGPVGGHPVFRNTSPNSVAARSLSVLVLDAKGRYTKPGAEVRLLDGAGKILATRQVETAGGYSSQSAGPVVFGLRSMAPVSVEVTFMSNSGRTTVVRRNVSPRTYAGKSLVIRSAR